MVQQVTPARPGQKTMVGVVISDKMDKTVVVSIERARRHRLYQKTIRHTKHYKAHDPNNVCKIGDTVRIVETRPISKEKRWRVTEILQHHLVAEIQPRVIGSELEQAGAELATADLAVQGGPEPAATLHETEPATTSPEASADEPAVERQEEAEG